MYKTNIILKLSLTNNTDDDDFECNYKLCTDLCVEDCCRVECKITLSLYTYTVREMLTAGAPPRDWVLVLCAAAARCGEMTPVRDLGRVYQVIPGYTRVYQHGRNTFQLMNITRCSLYSPGSASSRHQQPPRNEPAAAADVHPTSFKLRNFSALLCICSLQRCLIESFPPRPRLFIYWSV